MWNIADQYGPLFSSSSFGSDRVISRSLIRLHEKLRASKSRTVGEAIPTHSSPISPYVPPMFLAISRSYHHPFLPGFSLRPTPCSLLHPEAIPTHSSPSSPYFPPHVPCYTQKLSPPIPPRVLLTSHPMFLATPRSYPHPFLPGFSLRPTPYSLLHPGAIITHSSPSSPYVPPTFLATPRSYPHPFLPDFSLRPTHVPCYTQKLSPPIPPRVLLTSHPMFLATPRSYPHPFLP
ncbi:hypothetical protein RRG08_052610 [Elysia crispata]|uniref:Uncharacterized protein n=1 Tax=Elysia crispata TaxID=231223 RepID=A0AAE1A1A7_9GAST|nr:hypothetical protein RRG08_052610 [Elysia crispata]